VKDQFKNITDATSVTTGVFTVIRVGLMEQIKKGKIYILDNGFDPLAFIIALETENVLRYEEDIVYNMSLDFVEVLINNRIETVLVSDLHKITGVSYND
jgi:hypothetical protein